MVVSSDFFGKKCAKDTLVVLITEFDKYLVTKPLKVTQRNDDFSE